MNGSILLEIGVAYCLGDYALLQYKLFRSDCSIYRVAQKK